MSIAILCPTRARPEQLNRMLKSTMSTAKLRDKDKYHRVNVYAGLTIGDIESGKIVSNYMAITQQEFFNDMMPTVQKWNGLADYAMQDKSIKLFMLGSDDMYFDTPGWDKALIDHYNALENKIHVCALQDSRDANGTPHVIVTREYIEAMGYFMPPIFLHWFIDTWTVEIAKANSCFTHFKDFTLIHDKPSDRGNPDETFSRIRSWGWRERDAFVAEKCNHFLEFEKGRLAKCMKR